MNDFEEYVKATNKNLKTARTLGIFTIIILIAIVGLQIFDMV